MLRTFRALGDLQVIQLAPGEKVAEAVQHYRASGLVEFAEPDYKLHAQAITPNDPEFVGGTQWSLRNLSSPGHDINAAAGWQTLNSASNIVVAIVDSGIRNTHEDLAANLWTNPKEIADNGLDDDGNGIVDDVHGINAINSTGNIMDDAGHGTHVAGIVGAAGNNGVGIAGVAWKVQLMACKFLDNAGNGDTSDAIRCIDYARRNGAHIINASWGGTDYSAALNTAIANARAAGIIVVTAAGNDSVNIDSTPLYPACFTLDNIVVVAGTSRADVVDSSYSNYGPINVDLCAPGTGIYSTWNSWDGAYTYLSGTSMAAPHVAGVLALMKARFPAMSSAQLIARLYSTVDIIPALAGKCKTGGRVNLGRALGADPTASFSAGPLAGEPPLSVSFTNQTLGTLRSVRWDFGDGTPGSTNSNPTHVFAENGTFIARLTVVGTNNYTNSFEQTISVKANYGIDPEPFAWIDPTSMSPVSLADNGIAGPITLPFNFSFYGVNYSSLYVSANGVLGFDPNSLTTTDNTSLPASGPPNSIICPYWDNLNPAAGGTVYSGVTGSAPARRFVVSWVDVPRNSTPVALTFQAVLEEGSNEMVFQYLETHPETSRGGARRATIGVEDATGTTAALYTYNGAPYTLTNQMALRVKRHFYRYLEAQTSELDFRAVRGPAATNATATLQIKNPGNLDLEWSVAGGAEWFELAARSGTLHAGEALSIPALLSPAAASLSAGTYTASLDLKNETDGRGDATIPVQLALEEPEAILALDAINEASFVGGLGGPFEPSALQLQLRNNGNITLDWKESSDVPWIVAQPSRGTLKPGESSTIQITLGQTDFPPGTNTAVLSFSNQSTQQAPIQQSILVVVRSHVQETSAAIVNGIFQGELAVPVGDVYQVEYSDDLSTWTPLDATPVISGTMLKFQDFVNDGGQRFYRVRVD